MMRNNPVYTDVGLILFGGSCLYLVFELLSLIIQIIKNRNVYNRILSVMTNAPFRRTIDFYRPIALYGFISFFVCGSMIKGDIQNSLLQLFACYVEWAFPAYLLLAVVTVIALIFYMQHEGENTYSLPVIIGKTLLRDIFIPVMSLRILVRSEKKIMASISFIVYVVILVLNVIGILAILGII